MLRSRKVAFFLASRSILRGNWGIFVMSVSMISLVYINLIFTPSLLQGATDQADGQLRATYTSDIVITTSDKSGNITDVDSFEEQIRHIQGVDATTSTYRAGNYIAYMDRSVDMPVEAIDPDSYSKVFTNTIVDGAFLENDDQGAIVLGAFVAGNGIEDKRQYESSLRTVPMGDTVTTNIGTTKGVSLETKGVFYNQFIFADQRAFITKETLEEYVPQVHNIATSMYVRVADTADVSIVIAQIDDIREGLNIREPDDVVGFVQDQADTIQVINRILSVISFLVAAITIFIITYVDLVNRRKQIGIERAIGITGGSIIGAYALRALVYTVVGIVLGSVLYLFVIVPLIERYPFIFPSGEVTLTVQVGAMGTYAVFLLIISLIAATIPTWQSVRIKLLDAIWGSS